MQILLDKNRYQKMAREATRQGTSIAAIIREAIDRLPGHSAERRAAIAEILAAAPMSVPDDPAALRHELDDAHDRVKAWSSPI